MSDSNQNAMSEVPPVPVLIESIQNCETFEDLLECRKLAEQYERGTHERWALVDAYKRRRFQLAPLLNKQGAAS